MNIVEAAAAIETVCSEAAVQMIVVRLAIKLIVAVKPDEVVVTRAAEYMVGY